VFSGSERALVIDAETQSQINILKASRKNSDSLKWYPFNPNYITDFKGYTLGMSPEEIDRLLQFRAQNKFVNSAKEFQEVTLISDSLLSLIAPRFKFPDWTQKDNKQYGTNSRNVAKEHSDVPEDLNSATAEHLMDIDGIGVKLSARIVKFRDALGGFLIGDQIYDVYGLDPDVAKRVLDRFRVIEKPEVKKINLNTASVEELSRVVYLRHDLARKIIDHREQVGSFESFDELAEIGGFSPEKIERIRLYLHL
jgi:DNA uptake protein ComE-like DNA-binding protein